MADPIIPAAGLPPLPGLRLALQQAQVAILADLLQPGAVLSARVGEDLGGGAWRVQLGGRSIVAESPLPLTSGATIRLAVVSAGDQPLLRLLQPDADPALPPDDPAVQLARLGLPDIPATRRVLAAFVAAGAPLVPARLDEAAAASAAEPANEGLPAAYAAVARSGLPAMPLTIDLAQRAAQPRPAVATTAEPAPAAEAPRPTTTPAPVPGETPTTPPMAPAPAASPAPGATTAAITPTTAGSGLPLQPSLPPADGTPGLLPGAPAVDPEPYQAATSALRLAGLRPAPEAPPSPAPPDDRPAATHPAKRLDEGPPTVITRLAQAVIAHGPGDGAAAVAARAALVEATAHTVFPPADLSDYDMVLPLPLQERGLPVPARLAVATRRSSTGAGATWLRVDTELSRLGPVSARLAAADQGPLVVHLVAGSAALDDLAAIMPDLEAALAAKGFTASVRLSRDDG